jgi:asparagine synthetase B (glutamine-hydrolysing)
MARWYALVPHGIRRAAIDPLVRRLPVQQGYQRFEWKAKRFALRWDEDPGVRHLRWMSNLDLPDLAHAIPSMDGASLQWPNLGRSRDLNDILALDFQTYLPGSVLAKVDRASMAHGLEVRPPLLANELVDFAFSLDARCKLKGSTGKALLKRAVAGLLPTEIIHRRKKGFAIPLASWLRGPLRHRLNDVMQASRIWEQGLLSRQAFVEWQREHDALTHDHSRPLYALLVLDHWYRRAMM